MPRRIDNSIDDFIVNDDEETVASDNSSDILSLDDFDFSYTPSGLESHTQASTASYHSPVHNIDDDLDDNVITQTPQDSRRSSLVRTRNTTPPALPQSGNNSSDQPEVLHVSPPPIPDPVPAPMEIPQNNNHEESSPPNPTVITLDDDPSGSPVRKRRRVIIDDDDEAGPSTAPEKPAPVVEEEEDDGCTICYEDFSNCGDHRLVSLKCGHFFGNSCISRWIRGEGRSATCPSCKAKATVKDIRVHYCKAFKITDTTELEELKQTKVLQERRIAELELEVAKQQRIVSELQNKMKQNVPSSLSVTRRAGKIVLTALTKILLTKESSGYARAFDFDGSNLVVGVKNAGNLFSPFALRTIGWNNNSFQARDARPCHSSRTRVVCFSPFQPNLLLTGGEDKCAIIHYFAEKREKKKYKMPYDKQVWSGCWVSDDKIAVGCNDGRVWEYDLRSDSTEPTRDMTQGVGLMPIIFVSSDPRLGVLLVASFKTFVAFRNDRAFPLVTCANGETIRSVSWDESSLYFMLSFKAPSGFIHRLYKLDVEENGEMITCVEKDVWDNTKAFKCSTFWYNCLFSTESGLFAVIFNEDEQRLECFDWSRKRTTVMISFTMGNPSMMQAVPGPDSRGKVIFILTERSMFALDFKLSD